MLRRIAAISLIVIVFSGNLCSQCGTVITPKHADNPILVQNQYRSSIEYDLNRTLSVHIYVVANDYNSYDFTNAVYSAIWNEMNEVFAPINLGFQICEEIQIPNYNYNILNIEDDPDTGMNEEDEMVAQHYTPGVINVYYVEEIIGGTSPEGYAYFPGGPDIIVLTKGSGITTVAHEMGHFFGLYHTFETSFGLELVDGSNCETTGDLVCDTPADNNGLTANCTFISTATDANGSFYTPYISNYMSYYDSTCKCKFTKDQYNRMASIYLDQRNYLW